MALDVLCRWCLTLTLALCVGLPLSLQIPPAYSSTHFVSGETLLDNHTSLPPNVVIDLREICQHFDIASPGCECQWGKCLADRPSPSCRCPWGQCLLHRPGSCVKEHNISAPLEIPEKDPDDGSSVCGALGYAERDCICTWGKCQAPRTNAICACPWGRCMEDRAAYCQQSQLPCMTSTEKFDIPKHQECACDWGKCRTERPTSACACPWGECTQPRDQEICHEKEEEGPPGTRMRPWDNVTEWVMYGLASFLIILILSIVGFCLYQTRRNQSLPILQYTIEDFTIPAGSYGDVSCDCLILDDKPSHSGTSASSLYSTSRDLDTDATPPDAVIEEEDDDNRDNGDDDDDDFDLPSSSFGTLTPDQDFVHCDDRKNGFRHQTYQL